MKETTHIGIRTTPEEKRQVKLILECLEKETGQKYSFNYLVTNLINTFNKNPLIDLNLKRIDLINKIEMEKQTITTHENIKKAYMEELEVLEEKINNFNYSNIPNFTEDNQINKALNHMKLLINERNIKYFEDIPEDLFIATFNTFGVPIVELKSYVENNFNKLVEK